MTLRLLILGASKVGGLRKHLNAPLFSLVPNSLLRQGAIEYCDRSLQWRKQNTSMGATLSLR